MTAGKYQAYIEYKNSGIGWMGDVPEEWNILPCRAVVTNITDKNEGAKDQNYLSLMANVGIIRYEDKGDVGNKKPDDLSKCKIVKKGNLVINSMNYAIGSYGMSGYDGVCSPVYIVLDANTDVVERRFALRVFENRPFQKYLATFGNGILEHRAAIGWDDIKGAYIPLPSMDEQVAILNFIDYETAQIDALIEKQQQLISLLKEKRQAVISHAITKGLNPNAHMRDSGVEWLGEVPEHWVVTRAKFVSDIFIPQRNKPELNDSDGVSWATMEDMKNQYIESTKQFVNERASKEAGSKTLKAGSVIASCVGNFGIASINKVDVIINQQLQAFIPDGIKAEYLRDIVSTSTVYFNLIGTAATLVYVNQQGFENLPVLVPPENEQNEISVYADKKSAKFDKLMKKCESTIDLLQERRTALISAAVTGKIDVRNWQAPEPSNTTNKEVAA